MANSVKKTTTKKVAEKKVTEKKASPKKVTVEKTVKKPVTKATTTKKATTKKIGAENKIKASKSTLILTIVGIIACLACAVMDGLSNYYNNMPLYAILLFIIIVEDKK